MTISDIDISMDNYSLIRNYRNRKGGGVCVFVRSDMNYNVKSELDNDDDRGFIVGHLSPQNKACAFGGVL